MQLTLGAAYSPAVIKTKSCLTSNGGRYGALAFAGFGVCRTGQAAMMEESRVIRFLVATIGLFAALAPGLAHAQTNLDRGKSAATIFAADCVECHKAPHGIAKGKSVAQVTDFLHEHYTTSREQAAALAAYVLGARATEPVDAAQARGRKPAAERASASTEEPKPAKRQAKQSPKADEAKPANAKLRGSAPGQAEPEPKAPETPQEPAADGQAPAAAEIAPAPVEMTPNQNASPGPGPGPAPSAAAPSDAATGDSGDNAPVPRDNIPD
jgi:hypothetical protein